jgi:WD40 repeat protein
MKTNLALMLLALSSMAHGTEGQSVALTRDNVSEQPHRLTIGTSERGVKSKWFHVTVSAKNSKLPLEVNWGNLSVYNGEKFVSSCRVFENVEKAKVTFEFAVAPEYLDKSRFSFMAATHTPEERKELSSGGGWLQYQFTLSDFVAAPEKNDEGKTKGKLDPHGDPLPEHAIIRLGTLRWRPQNGAQSLGISAGSKLIATGHSGNIVRIWDAGTGHELHHWQSTPTSRGNAAVRVNCFAFSPPGKIVAVGNSAGIIEIRELSTGKEIRRFKGASEISALAFTEDGQTLAAGYTRGGIDLWDVAGGKKLRSCTGPSNGMGCLTFTFDGKHLAGADRQDPLIHLWDTATGKEIISFRGHENGVETVAFTIDDKSLWSVSSDQTIRRWNVATGKEEHKIKAITKFIHDGVGPSDPVHPAAAFSRDQKVLASLSEEKKIRLWDTATGKEIHVLPAESTGIGELAFSRDGTFIAAAGNDQTLRLWDAMTGKERGPLVGHRDWIGALVCSTDGKQIVSSSWDRTARIWDVASGKELKQFTHPAQISDVALSKGRLVTVGGYRDNTVKIWDITSDKLIQEWKGKTYYWTTLFSPDGDHLIAANGVDSVVMWNIASKERVRTFDGPGMRLALSPDGKLLAATGNNSDWYVWDFESGKQIYKEHKPTSVFGPTGVAFSPDSKMLALGCQDGVSLRDASSGKKRAHFGNKPLYFVAFSPDGKLLATASDADKGPNLELWDVKSEKQIREWNGHRGGVRTIAFSPDGRQLASAGMDTTILFWDVASLLTK